MKLWELVSAFREHGAIVRDVLAGERWRDPYLGRFDRFDSLVQSQDRGTLDEVLPVELTREVAARIPDRYVYDAERVLRKATSDARGEVLTTLEVHDRFGGSLIEEVLEYGSARMPTSGE
ncbi:MAG TPA: hypothetical protein VFQ51_00720 [Vicinamibacteria bacterium]|nr:hypothetical protein [Vicinamibacteria bacterium]